MAGVLVDVTGWQGLFWIDAAIAAVCVPLTLRGVPESHDPNRPPVIDWTGTVLIAVVLAPLILAFTEGSSWGWISVATFACFAVSIGALFALAKVERHVRAPLIDLALLRNRDLVGATLAILIAAGAINGLMYLLSLYFQDPAGLGMSALQAGLATLPAALGIILIATAVAGLAEKIGAGRVILLGFAAMTAGFTALAFVHASWNYLAFLLPITVVAVGMGFANGPASSISTACVRKEQVGAASGISNMARYVGAALLTAAVAALYSSGTAGQEHAGATASEALAHSLSQATILLAAVSFVGVGLTWLGRQVRARRARAVDYAAHAASTSHTIPVGGDAVTDAGVSDIRYKTAR